MKYNSTLTVSLNAIFRNVDVLQSHLKPGVKQMAVVKADAYGHGAVPVARKLSSKVHWFAVNTVDEGIELRKNGIKNPILVFGVPEKEFASCYKQYDLTATVSSVGHFEILPAGTAYHLNFDTGMGRLGFRPGQTREVHKHKINHPEITCNGIYSHLATADEPDSVKPDEQMQLFEEIHNQFEPDLLRHIGNTAAAVRSAKFQLNMVRTGIGMYGYPPGHIAIPGLEPAMRWQTRLVQIKPVKKGETVSYGATWQAPEDGYTGTIPVGYHDGVPRGMSGHFLVTVNGRRYPVAGTVTMNYCIVALGKKPLPAGTNVELWNAEHNAQTWAETMRTISYEMLTRLSPNIQRIYI